MILQSKFIAVVGSLCLYLDLPVTQVACELEAMSHTLLTVPQPQAWIV